MISISFFRFNELRFAALFCLNTISAFICCSNLAFAADVLEYRNEVFKEVMEQLSDKNKELAEQLVDIRINQETKMGVIESNISKLKKPVAVESNASKEKIDPINTDLISSSVKSENLINSEVNNFTYVSIGNRFVLGYSWGAHGIFYLRTDISGDTKTDLSRNINGYKFILENKNISIGTYLDWHPFNSPFRVSGGIHVNDMRTKLTSTNKDTYVINNSSLTLANAFSADFTFPAVTPYLGIGYNNTKAESPGLNFFADAGVMIGRYNAYATLNAVGGQVVNNADVDAELNNLRNALFKYDYVPLANFGLTYRFR
jgi:hypothetical protein